MSIPQHPVWRLEDNLQESVFSFHHMGPSNETQVVHLSSRHYPLAHLISLVSNLYTNGITQYVLDAFSCFCTTLSFWDLSFTYFDPISPESISRLTCSMAKFSIQHFIRLILILSGCPGLWSHRGAYRHGLIFLFIVSNPINLQLACYNHLHTGSVSYRNSSFILQVQRQSCLYRNF